MTNAKIIQEYCQKCGLDVTVDGKTLILSAESGPKEISTLDDINDILNVGYLPKIYRKKSVVIGNNKFDICDSEYVTYIVDSTINKLLMLVPVYENGRSKIKNNKILITGHEETVFIDLNNLHESFCYYTR